jgi:hypothetical protein
MNTQVAAAFEEIQKIIDAAAADKSLSRADYRELVEETVGFCEIVIEGLDSDDERDAASEEAEEAAEEEAEQDEKDAEGDVQDND